MKRRNMDGSMISELLPEPILHQILSLLSQKDAVRTCVLSKSWRHLWYARPEIKFRRSDFVCRCSPKTPKCRSCLDEKKNIFRLALEKTLQRYHFQKLTIENIELEMFVVDSQWISLLQKWIPLLIIPNMSLKTFSLCFSRRSSTKFDLPWVVFQVKCLKKLCLESCNVNHPTGGKVRLECLQTLSLKKVFIEVDTLEMLMSSCPLIENVFLKKCKGLEAPNVIRIKHNNLKHFCFKAYLNLSYDDSPGIEIDAPNLISLSLQEVQLYTNYFKNLSSKFPRLEDLSVVLCKGHGELKLSSPSIKRLNLGVWRHSIMATIDAPNLLDFKFVGEFPETSFTFVKTSSEWKSHVVLDFMENFFNDGDFPWFRNLGELLRALSKSQICLEACFDSLPPNQHIEECGFNHERVVVENVRLRLGDDYANSSPSLPHFMNGLFSVCRPTYTQTLDRPDLGKIAVSDNFDNQLIDFLCKVLVQEREKRDYFWQKDLEEVCMEVWDKVTNEWNPTSVAECGLPSKQNIRFQLKWRD